MRQVVYGTSRIGLNRTFAQSLADHSGVHVTFLPFHLKALSAMASGSIAVCLGTPFDVALVRMQSDTMKPVAGRRNYRSVFDALIRVTATEGTSALYTGLVPNILRGMAMNVGMLSCYDQAKASTMVFFGDTDPEHVSMSVRVVSAGIAGFAAAFLSLPCDLIKSRLQDMKPCPVRGTMPYRWELDMDLLLVCISLEPSFSNHMPSVSNQRDLRLRLQSAENGRPACLLDRLWALLCTSRSPKYYHPPHGRGGEASLPELLPPRAAAVASAIAATAAKIAMLWAAVLTPRCSLYCPLLPFPISMSTKRHRYIIPALSQRKAYFKLLSAAVNNCGEPGGGS